MNVQKKFAIAVASLGWKSRSASVVFVLHALLLGSLVICAPAARAQSWGEVVLHSFDLADGAEPLAGVIQGNDGNFYGTTYVNGPNGTGTVFKLTPSGTLTTLHSFCSVIDPSTGACLDGGAPTAGLIQGSDGNFYGTTSGGGASANGGTVFKITPSGMLTTLYSFCSQTSVTDSELFCTDGQNPSAAPIQGSDGNFYGTTALGGANGSGNPNKSHDYFGGTVFKLTSSGTLTTLYSFCSQGGTACTDGSEPFAGVIQGSDGNFYGTTLYGGANGDGTVFKLTPSGTLTTLYSFCSQGGIACTDGADPFAGVIQGSDGNFYGTTLGGGAKVGGSGGTVFRLTPSGTLSILYSFCNESASDCTSGNYSNYPYSGVIQGSDGNFFGTTTYGSSYQYEAGSGSVFRLTPSGTLTTLYWFGSVGSDGGSPTAGVIQGSDGNLYGTTRNGGLGGGTVFELGAALPIPTPTATPTPTPTPTPTASPTMPGHIRVVPKEMSFKAGPNATASASITITNTGTGSVTVEISKLKHSPPFSEVGGGRSIAIGPGDDYQVTITYSPTNSTRNREKSDSITVKAISNDPKQKRRIDVNLKGED